MSFILDRFINLVFKLLLDERLGNQSSRIDKPDPQIAIYPDLHFTYNITKKKSIQFGMSKRVERPGSHGHGGGKMQIRPFPRNLYAEGNVFIGNKSAIAIKDASKAFIFNNDFKYSISKAVI